MNILEIEKTQSVFTQEKRPRRNRKSESIRHLLCENRLHPADFIAPFFVLEGEERSEPIESMPGVERMSIDLLLRRVEEVQNSGVRSILLFAYVPAEKKDRYGKEALNRENTIFTALRVLKKEFPNLSIMVDIALDPYTTHGHDGLIDEDGEVLNDPTLEVLAQMALLAAEAGADVVAPSDMMDGRVGFIRKALDREGYTGVSILSYAVKFASAFYGPFRDALDSCPKIGDKKGYQINPANAREALLECTLDEAEGADMLMVKPALAYLDIIAKYKESTLLPVGGYHVSGEYSMVMAAAEKGWIDGPKALAESLISMKRAGADFIVSYVACQPQLLKEVVAI